MTADTPYSRLFDCIVDIAAAAPKRQGQNVYAASIPWTLVHQLRDLLDECGITWRTDV